MITQLLFTVWFTFHVNFIEVHGDIEYYMYKENNCITLILN